MELTKDDIIARKISWGSIVGGVIIVISISLMLSILGTSLGLSIVDPLGDDPDNGASMTILFWTGGAIIISLAAGAFVAGRLAANDGFIHGFLVWATSFIIVSIVGTMLVGSAVKATGSALASLASASGSLISGAGSVSGAGLEEIGSFGSNMLDGLDIDISFDSQKLQSNVKEAIRKSKIPSLQPEFMQQQLDDAKQDITSAIKILVTQPKDAETIIQNLAGKLQERGEVITKNVDRETLIKALSENTDMTQDDINQIVNNIIEAKDMSDKFLKQKFEDIQVKIEQSKNEYEALKKKTLEHTADAASTMAKLALWTFFALFVMAIISGFLGRFGCKTARLYV